MGDSYQTNLAGFLLKLYFMRKCTDGPGRRFTSLTKVWSSRESLSKLYVSEHMCVDSWARRVILWY